MHNVNYDKHTLFYPLQLSLSSRYPERIMKTSDFVLRSLWYNPELQQLLASLGFYEVGQSLLFNKTEGNQLLLKSTLAVVTALLGKGVKPLMNLAFLFFPLIFPRNNNNNNNNNNEMLIVFFLHRLYRERENTDLFVPSWGKYLFFLKSNLPVTGLNRHYASVNPIQH